MLINFKNYLIVPMWLIGAVNVSTTQVNAMQVINQNMSKEDLKEIMSNLVTDNNTALTDESMAFISKLSDKAEQIINNTKLDDLIKQVKNNKIKI